MTEKIGPDYQRVTDDMRSKINSGGWPVGSKIPSTPQLQALYGVSVTVVRRAVGILKDEGILIGHPGKAVFVRATSDDVAGEQQDTEALALQVNELRNEVHGLTAEVQNVKTDDIREALSLFEARLTRVEVHLEDLYTERSRKYPGADQEGRDGTAHGNRNSA